MAHTTGDDGDIGGIWMVLDLNSSQYTSGCTLKWKLCVIQNAYCKRDLCKRVRNYV